MRRGLLLLGVLGLLPIAACGGGGGGGGANATAPARFVYTANEGDNAVAGFRFDDTTGALTPLAGSPFGTGSMPIHVVRHPSGRFIYVANQDSGTVSGFAADPVTGALTELTLSP